MDKNNSLKKQVILSSFWLFGGNVVSRFISLVSTLILAKLLTPTDFGVIGYGFLVVQTVGLFRQMGFNSALIYQDDNISVAASTALWFSAAWSSCLYIIIFLMAPLAAGFFREPQLVPLLRVLSVTLIINSLSNIPMALMEKSIDFRKRIIPDVAQLSIYGIVTVILAFMGLRYWSFVIGNIIADIIQLIIAFSLTPVKINFKPDRKLFKSMFSFGKNIMGLGVIYFGIRNIDDFFVGRMLGTSSLGIYQFSYRIANIPATNISNVLGKLLYPSYKKIANQDWELKNAFLKTFRYIVFLTIPVTFYIILVIPGLINKFYINWIGAIVPIQLLAYFGGMRAIGSGSGSVFYAKGKPDQLVPIAVKQFLMITVLIYPAVYYLDVIGACLAINVSITYSFFATLFRLKKLIGLEVKWVFKILIFPFCLSIFIFLILHFIDNFAVKLLGFPLLILLGYHLLSDIIKKMRQDLKSVRSS